MGISCMSKLKYKNIFEPVKTTKASQMALKKIKNNLMKNHDLKQEKILTMNSNDVNTVKEKTMIKTRMANTLNEIRDLFSNRFF